MNSLATVRRKAANGEPVTMVTAYDSAMAQLVDRSDVELLLVGDSVGLAALGYDGTDRVTMAEMLHHAKAVTRVVEDTVVMVDLPYGSYNVSPEQAVENANRLKKEGGADAVKLEGGTAVADAVAAITAAGIPVFGHVGVTPQTAESLDVRGRTAEDAEAVLSDARAIDEAGASGLVLELVAEEVVERITRAVDGVTIGIGAGPDCDAQVVTLHDLLGLQDLLPDTAVGIGRDLGTEVVTTLDEFHRAVADGEFPSASAVESMPEEAAREFED